jgi:hypothetical protein
MAKNRSEDDPMTDAEVQKHVKGGFIAVVYREASYRDASGRIEYRQSKWFLTAAEAEAWIEDVQT